MPGRIWFLARHEVRLFLKSWSSLLWMFVMPVFFMYFTGLMSGQRPGGSRHAGPEPKPIVLLVASRPGAVTGSLAGYLGQMNFEARIVPSAADSNAAMFVVNLPDSLEERVAAGKKCDLILHPGGDDELSSRLQQARLTRAVIRTLGDIALLAASDSTITGDRLERLAHREPAVKLEAHAEGTVRHIPIGFRQSVPGTLVMFMMLVLLTGGTSQIYTDRKEGLLRRLASSTLSRGEIVTSRVVSRTILAIIQAAFAVLVGTFVFRIDWGPYPAFVFLVLLIYGLAVAALSVLLGSLARSMGQAIGLGVILSILMGALGGCWWPIEIVPRAMQAFALLLPTGWAMQGLHRLMELGRSPVAALPSLLALAGYALILTILGARKFRFD